MSLFSGLSAFPITPTDARGVVDTVALNRLLERLTRAKVDSIGLLGSTGGYAYLTRAERKRAIQAAVRFVDRETPVIVSVGALRTDDAKQLAQDAQAAGADGLLLAPVSYTPLTQEEAFNHYVTVAKETDLPLSIYNNPGTTHFTFSKPLLERLSRVRNIRAVKMPLPENMDYKSELAQLRQITPDGFAIGYSGDWGCADGLLAGADAWYSVIGGLFPDPTIQLARAAQNGDAEEVRRIDDYFRPMWSLFQEFGSLRIVYAAANILGLTDAKPHLPVMSIGAADQARVGNGIDALNNLD